jgi:hypothetical protein
MNNLSPENALQPMPLMKQTRANMDDLEFAEIFHRERGDCFPTETRSFIRMGIA